MCIEFLEKRTFLLKVCSFVFLGLQNRGQGNEHFLIALDFLVAKDNLHRFYCISLVYDVYLS